MTTRTKTNDRVGEALGQLLDMFESGNFPETIARTMIHRDANSVPSASWSLGNQILMMLAGTYDGRTFKAWKDVGRSVKKNPDTFYILRPVKKTIYYEDEETGEKKKKQITIGFAETPRYRVEDTEGEELVIPDYKPMQLPPLAEVAQEMGVKVEYAPGGGDYYGYYQPNRDFIALCSHDAAVYFHELAHAADKRNPMVGRLKPGQDKDQEIVAETVSAVLSLMYGLEGYVPNCKEYIAGYAQKEKPLNAIMRVLSRVQAALELILSHAPEARETASS